MKIVMAGSSGFIGTALVHFLEQNGHQVIRLVRNRESGSPYWNPEKKEIDAHIFDGVECVINLSGESILGRWTEKKKKEIKESRVISSQFLANTLAALPNPPKLYINASAIGIYGDRGNEKLTEASPPGSTFLAEVCKEWEAAAEPLSQKRVRVCTTRFGLVVSKEGGFLKKIISLFSTGMGGILGDGTQFVSWIALDDLLRAMLFVMEKTSLFGPINFVSPNPITNKQMTRMIGEAMHQPTLLSVPEMMLSLMFGSGSEMFLASVNVYPQKLLDNGFTFTFPKLEELLKKELSGYFV